MHQYPDYVQEDTPRGRQWVSLGTGMRIVWQEGPLADDPYGPNGAMPELPVRAVLQRIEQLNQALPCPQNREIILHLRAVLGLFDQRTFDRNSRGVLGTRQA